MNQRENQLPASTAAPRRDRATLVEKMGWGMLGVAVALWGVASLLLVYGGASLHTGWSLLAAFVALITVSFALIGTSGQIERLLLRWRSSHEEPVLSPTDRSWAELWEELMRRPVR